MLLLWPRLLFSSAVTAALSVCVFSSLAHADSPLVPPRVPVPKRDAPESAWIKYVADPESRLGGLNETEVRLADDSRVDVMGYHVGNSRMIAWEVERAHKWREAIGQSAFYKTLSGANSGGVILIVLDGKSEKLDVLRCAMVCRALNLEFRTVDEHGVIR